MTAGRDVAWPWIASLARMAKAIASRASPGTPRSSLRSSFAGERSVADPVEEDRIAYPAAGRDDLVDRWHELREVAARSTWR